MAKTAAAPEGDDAYSLTELHRSGNYVVTVQQYDLQGNRCSLGPTARWTGDGFNVEEIAANFGGGRYYITWREGGKFIASTDHFVSSSVRPRPQAPPPPPPMPGYGAAPQTIDPIMALVAKMDESMKHMADMAAKAGRPRTVAEMSGEEFAQTIAKSLGAQQPAGIAALKPETILGLAPIGMQLLKMFRPRSSFEEGLQAFTMLDKLRRGESAEDEEEGMNMAKIVGDLRKDPIVRGFFEKLLDAWDTGDAPRKPVENQAQRKPQAAAPTAATTPAQPATPGTRPARATERLPATIRPFVPALAEEILKGVTEKPETKPHVAAEELVDHIGAERLTELFAQVADGDFALALVEADAKLKPRTPWLLMVEGAMRIACAEEPDDDETDTNNAGDAPEEGTDGNASDTPS